MFSNSCITDEDAELVLSAKSGNGHAFELLAKKYNALLLSKVQTSKFSDNYDDFLQEAYFGFFKAVISFDETLGVPFCGYAKLCVERQVYTAVKKSEKFNIEDFSFCDMTDSSATLEDSVIDRQSCKDLITLANARLSGYERQVLRLYLLDLTYEEISKRTGKNIKSVDNALKRIKSKIVTDLMV